ncbi:unnamed protein product [Prunus brigantina]
MLFDPSSDAARIDRLIILGHAIALLRSRRSKTEKIKGHANPTPSSDFSRTYWRWLIWNMHLSLKHDYVKFLLRLKRKDYIK